MMDKHEEEEAILEEIARGKCETALIDEADETACNEDEESNFHAVRDGIWAGLRHSKKEDWAVQVGEGEFDTAVYAFFIGKSFKEVKARIEKLPNKLTAEEGEALAAKIKEIVPEATEVQAEKDTRTMNATVVPPEDKIERFKDGSISYYNFSESLPKSVDGVRIQWRIQPLKIQKKQRKRVK